MMEIKILAAVCWPWVAVFASPANERSMNEEQEEYRGEVAKAHFLQKLDSEVWNNTNFPYDWEKYRHEAESEISKMSSQSPELAKQIDELKRLDRGHFDTKMVVERKTQKIWSAGKPKLESRGRNPRATNDCRRDPHKEGCPAAAYVLEFDVPGNYNEDLNEDGFSIAKAKLTVKIRSGRARKGQAKFLLNLCDKNKPTVCSQQHVNDKTDASNEVTPDISNLLRNFLRKQENISRLILTVNLQKSPRGPRVISAISETEFLVTTVSHEDSLNRRPRQINLVSDNYTNCGLRKVTVTFSEMKGWEHIHHPKSYDITYCSGKCRSSDVKIKWINNKQPPHAYHSCCVPDGTEPMEVMFTNNNKVHMVKELPDMRVTKCRCT